MFTVLLILHLLVTLALIGIVLIQRSEGGGLGIGSSQSMGSFMGGRGTANLLTRTTAILATIFMGLSLALAVMNRGTSAGNGLLGAPPPPAPATSKPAPPPAPPPPAGPVVPGSMPAAPAQTAPAPTAPAQTAPAQTSPVPGAPAASAPAHPAPAAPASAQPKSGG